MAADRPPIARLLGPFREFFRSSAAGGVLLFGAAVIALVWANSPFGDAYFAIWETPIELGTGGLSLSTTLLHVVNDGLMTIFFLVVGLEIKRELLIGELASRSRATLPLAAAVGGAILPAIIFIGIVGLGPEERGWGIPMATDIAFALGVLAVLGSRVPVGLKVFVTAFAIADDLIAVLVIALFYTSDLSASALLAAGVILVALVVANRLGVRRLAVYGVLGVALWYAVLQSGVHATVAGVALAAVIPARGRTREPDGDQDRSPLLRAEHALQPWVAFVIVPLFALANAGVALTGDVVATLTDPVFLGIAVGLIVGKQIGISVAALAVVRLGLASLPAGVGWRHIYGAAWLGGIGFTMSLFIAELAFGGSAVLSTAKLGILAASAIAGVGGYLYLRAISATRDHSPREGPG